MEANVEGWRETRTTVEAGVQATISARDEATRRLADDEARARAVYWVAQAVLQ